MTTVTPGAVEVRQIDREAAADAVRAYRDQKNGDWQGRIRRGECDDGYMVQAFARHRIAATPPDALQTVVEALREAKSAMECAAGCDEGVSQDEAFSEILSFGGTALAMAYSKACASLPTPPEPREPE